jgi:uncharacterized protein
MTVPESDLKTLLSHLSPRLNAGEFVFLSLKEHLVAHIRPLATFHEWEGESVVLRKEQADTIGLKHGADTYAWITLDVNSPLDSVGLTAAVSTALTAEGIPCNVVAAFHHDHVFVPTSLAKKAMEILKKLEKSGEI